MRSERKHGFSAEQVWIVVLNPFTKFALTVAPIAISLSNAASVHPVSPFTKFALTVAPIAISLGNAVSVRTVS
ncbi:hypothetical protein T484DRAFT_1774107 [Baffinella frigidus]|nr:hypothetical protein T484DRAFT_1774107 [Cryptophyta sp. CCMP2293]